MRRKPTGKGFQCELTLRKNPPHPLRYPVNVRITSPHKSPALDLKPLYEQKARERQGTRTDLNIGVNLPRSTENKTRETLAELAGVSGRTLDKVEHIRKEDVL
jgi:hypothetical protein